MTIKLSENPCLNCGFRNEKIIRSKWDCYGTCFANTQYEAQQATLRVMSEMWLLSKIPDTKLINFKKVSPQSNKEG